MQFATHFSINHVIKLLVITTLLTINLLNDFDHFPRVEIKHKQFWSSLFVIVITHFRLNFSTFMHLWIQFWNEFYSFILNRECSIPCIEKCSYTSESNCLLITTKKIDSKIFKNIFFIDWIGSIVPFTPNRNKKIYHLTYLAHWMYFDCFTASMLQQKLHVRKQIQFNCSRCVCIQISKIQHVNHIPLVIQNRKTTSHFVSDQNLPAVLFPRFEMFT